MVTENWAEIDKMVARGKSLDGIISSLKNDEIVTLLPTDIEEGMFYLEYLEKFKSHNHEKNRDKEGEEFYARIDEYIARLNSVFQ